MNHTELTKAIAAGTEMTMSSVDKVLRGLADAAMAELHDGGEVTLIGIGKLKASTRVARTGRNPKTGESIEIPAKNTVKFSPAKTMTDAIN